MFFFAVRMASASGEKSGRRDRLHEKLGYLMGGLFINGTIKSNYASECGYRIALQSQPIAFRER